MKCKVCGKELADDAKFCTECGNAVEPKENTYEQTVIVEDVFGSEYSHDHSRATTYCTNCGKPLMPNAEFCLNCGTRVGGNSFVPKKVGFVEAYKLYWKKYFDFSHRASVNEYWYVVLWNIIISFFLSTIQSFSGVDAITNAIFGIESTTEITALAIVVYALVWIWDLANIIPRLALVVRRLHDVGKSGFYWFMLLIPIVGWIFVLVALIRPSQQGRNQYD